MQLKNLLNVYSILSAVRGLHIFCWSGNDSISTAAHGPLLVMRREGDRDPRVQIFIHIYGR